MEDFGKLIEKYLDAPVEGDMKMDEDVTMALSNDIDGFVQADDLNKFQRFFMTLQEIIRNKAKKNMELNPLVNMVGRIIDEIRNIGA